MARLPRSELLPAHGFFHVTARGVGDEAIFRDDADRLAFLARLRDAVDRFEWRSYAFCLMTTHYHVVVAAARARLSAGLHRVNGVYAQQFNRRYNRRGHLFADRFSAWVIKSDEHLQATCRYVLLNPVRARICDDAAAYPWSGSRYGKKDLAGGHRHAVSWTGARSLSGCHQPRFTAYHSTVSRSPSSHAIAGSQPSSRRIFVASSR